MPGKTKKLVLAALMAALSCVTTMLITIPLPWKGYLNLGDCIVLAAGWILAPGYGFFAAALGSALADIFSGYALYAPATFLIKGLMALIACYGYRLLHKKIHRLPARILSGITAEILMVLGYFVFEGFLYGFAPSLVSIPANGLQGGACLILGIALMEIFVKTKIISE